MAGALLVCHGDVMSAVLSCCSRDADSAAVAADLEVVLHVSADCLLMHCIMQFND
jgi:hypothetical protein